MKFWQSYCKNKTVQFFASQCTSCYLVMSASTRRRCLLIKLI